MLPCQSAAENCVVVAEGEMGHDGVFKVYALGFPSCETRSQLPATAQVWVAVLQLLLQWCPMTSRLLALQTD